MKYCINYNKKSKYLHQADEVNINVIKEKMTVDATESFLKEFEKQRVNFIIKADDDLSYYGQFFHALHETYSNFSVRIYASAFAIGEVISIAETMDNFNIPYYFSFGAKDWETFNFLTTTNVSDIFVIEGLGFEMDRILKAKEMLDIDKQIRVFPNIAQSTWTIEPIKKFFIVPRDVDKYEPYVDVMDLSFDVSENGEVFTDTLYEVYAINKCWNGNLNEIIKGLDLDIDARALTPVFTNVRLDCARRCFKGTPCAMCKSCTAYADILFNKYVKKVDEEIRHYLTTGEMP